MSNCAGVLYAELGNVLTQRGNVLLIVRQRGWGGIFHACNILFVECPLLHKARSANVSFQKHTINRNHRRTGIMLWKSLQLEKGWGIAAPRLALEADA